MYIMLLIELLHYMIKVILDINGDSLKSTLIRFDKSIPQDQIKKALYDFYK